MLKTVSLYNLDQSLLYSPDYRAKLRLLLGSVRYIGQLRQISSPDQERQISRAYYKEVQGSNDISATCRAEASINKTSIHRGCPLEWRIKKSDVFVEPPIQHNNGSSSWALRSRPVRSYSWHTETHGYVKEVLTCRLQYSKTLVYWSDIWQKQLLGCTRLYKSCR